MNKISKRQKYIDKLLKIIYTGRNFEFFYNKGVDFYNKKKYDKAVQFFKFALDRPQVQPQVYYNLALTYQYMKKYDRAIVTYNKFLELRPNDYDGLYNLALTYYSLEKYQKATELFEKCMAIKKDEDGVKALILSYLEENQVQKAIDFAEEVIQEGEKGLKLYYSIAKVFETKNFLNKDFTYIDTAIEMYAKITQLDPKNFDAYLSISICYAKRGEWQQSVDFCKKAIATNPKSYEANNQMGLVYYCCNQITESIKYYETALKLKPEGDYKIYSNLAYAYEKMGEKRKAVKIFSQLIKKFPQYPAKNEIKNHLRILKAIG